MLEILLDYSPLMAEQKIDLMMLSRVDSDQKAIASRVDAIEKELHGLGREVSEIKGGIRSAEIPWWVKSIVAPACVLAIAATGGAVIHLEILVSGIGTNISKVQGSLAPQSLTAYAALPPADFRAAVPDVGSYIAAARKHNVRVPPGVVDTLSKQLEATATNATDFWPTVAELINYRSALNHEDMINLARPMPRCVDTRPSPATTARAIEQADKDLPQPQFVPLNPGHYDNCSIQLDSSEETTKLVNQTRGLPPLSGVPLVFRHCFVIYNGGNIRLQVPFPIKFDNCLWQLSVPRIPPDSGQKITKNLLTSNPDSVTLPGL